MVEVFQTNVKEALAANRLVVLLLEHFPKSKINFDLYDCDNILRVEGKDFITEKIMRLINENGYTCKLLE